ncbi:pilus assembly PilX family protein [Vreelandella massiliensis]|uniref:pilus assembly PilX family protein n=1 Tax=Vreelandella massiliensis TaxID=1816686 RepID=UPI00096AA028|nr:PilX N-terminal domain-containing pilus assembly protein [Halomonas massiliensis]
MHQQQGAALVIVLALLAGSLMIGISGMNSALIDERLAGNYRAAALAQMAAEDVAGYIRTNYVALKKEDNENWGEPDSNGFVLLKNPDVLLDQEYVKCVAGNTEEKCQQAIDFYKEETGNNLRFPFFLARGYVLERTEGKKVAEHIIAVAQNPGTKDPYDYPTNIDATLLCVGAGCPGSHSFDDYFFGEANLPNDFDCKGAGCRPGSGDRVGEQERPNENFYKNIYSREEGEKKIEDWKKFVEGLRGDKLSSGSVEKDISNKSNVIEITGDEVKSSGNINTSGIIVVRSGGVFNAGGTGSHEGLIIVESSRGVEGEEGYKEAGQVTLGKNYSLYGSLVSFDGLSNITVNSATPNGGARYNASALTGLGGGYVWIPL